jgi:hypothetical protein
MGPNVAGIVLGLLLGVFLYPTLASKISALAQKERNGPATLAKRGSDVLDFWPTSRAWSWTVSPVATKARVGVCVRTVESELSDGKLPAIDNFPKLPAKGTGTDKHGGWLGVGDKRLEAKVACQIIDFREVGLGEAAAKRPLRLLVKLKVNGTAMGIEGSASILEGETIVGVSEVEPKWDGDELLLLTVYTKSGNKAYTHYVLVMQADKVQ